MTKVLKLTKLHPKQKLIRDGCLSDLYFYIVAVIGRQFGKTLLGMNLSLLWAINTPNTLVYWVSPTDAQAQKVLKNIIKAVRGLPMVKSHKASKGDGEIQFMNGSKILFRSAASEDSLRGEAVNYLILDEAAFMKKSTVEEILLPMLTVRGIKCLFLTTPKGKNYIYDYYKKGLEEGSNWKSFRFSSYDSPYATPQAIENLRDTLTPKLFEQEVEAKFIDSSSAFNNVNTSLTLDRLDKPLEGEVYYAGIDIGIVNDSTAIVISDKNYNIVNFYKLDRYDTQSIMDEILRINKIWKFKKIYIENNNQGLPIYQQLKPKMSNLMDFNTNTKTKPEIINRLIHLFNIKGINIVKDEQIQFELDNFIITQSATGHLKFHAIEGLNDDLVMALAICVRCVDDNKSKNTMTFFSA